MSHPPTQVSGRQGTSRRRVVQTIRSEIRSYPATSVFAVLWVVVFLAMAWVHFQAATPPTWWRFLILGMGNGHRFGDLTLAELEHGQVWRLMTCTFVHYSLVHILLNLLAFYLLGTLIESWYGSAQLILVYGVTGAGGNLVSAAIRHALQLNEYTHSGGGSVVVMGLIGLCAVVGWRARSERGAELGWQMSKALAMTGLLGIAFPRYIDNWGHAGGAIVGFGLGMCHRALLRRYSSPGAFGTGVLTAATIAGCWLVQYRNDQSEAPIRRQIAQRLSLERQEQAYWGLRSALLLSNQGVHRSRLRTEIDRAAPSLDGGQTRQDFLRLQQLTRQPDGSPLSGQELQEFQQLAARLIAEVRREMNASLRFYRQDRSSQPPIRVQR